MTPEEIEQEEREDRIKEDNGCFDEVSEVD